MVNFCDMHAHSYIQWHYILISRCQGYSRGNKSHTVPSGLCYYYYTVGKGSSWYKTHIAWEILAFYAIYMATRPRARACIFHKTLGLMLYLLHTCMQLLYLYIMGPWKVFIACVWTQRREVWTQLTLCLQFAITLPVALSPACPDILTLDHMTYIGSSFWTYTNTHNYYN